MQLSPIQKQNNKHLIFKYLIISPKKEGNSDLLIDVCINSNLQKSSFKTAYNVTIDPEQNTLKKTNFSLQNIAGLLVKYGVEIE